MSNIKETNIAASKNENKGLSLSNTFSQDDVPQLLEVVNAKISALKKGVPAEPQTTGELDGFGKIKDINDLDTLIKAHSSVTNREKCYHASAQEIVPEAIKIPPFKLNGSTANQWIADIKKRVIEVSFSQELRKLEQVKSKLEENLSAKDRLANDLKSIANMMMS